MKRRFRRKQLNNKQGLDCGTAVGRVLARKLGKKGFSLPELIIVVALMGILAVLTITGIIVFARDLKLMEMDGIARQIFVSAQNHLTRMETSGLLSDYEEAASAPGTEGETAKAALGAAMDKAEDYPADYPAADGKSHAETWLAEVVDNDSHAFYRVGHRSGPDDKADNNLESSILQDMLPFGAIDDTVRSGGSYYIEYDLKTAQLYAVFYTDSADGLSEEEVKQLNANGRFDDEDGCEVRKSLLKTAGGGNKTVGYYGGAAAQNLEPVELDEPEIEIYNGEKLQVVIRDYNYFKNSGQGSFNRKTGLEVTVTGVDSGKSQTINMFLDDAENPDRSYDPSAAANKTWLWDAYHVPEASLGGVTVPEHIEYTLTLDDISKAGQTNSDGSFTGTHFADIFPDMYPGENVRIEAKLTSNNVLCSTVSAQAMTNSLFADANHITKGTGELLTDTGELAVKVSAVRHLENLNPVISCVSNNVNTVDVVGNISWNDYVDDNKSSDGKAYVYSYKEGSDTVNRKRSTDSFYPIESPSIESFRGNRFVLSDFVIDKSKMEADGIKAIGLFSRIGLAEYGNKPISIDGLTLQNFNINGNNYCDYAGALVGHIGSGFSDVQIKGVLVMRGTKSVDESSVTGAKNCGGMIGYSNVSGSGDGLKVTNCTVAGTVVGISHTFSAENSGGLIGLLGGRYADIRNSYTSGMTLEGKYSSDSEDCNVKGTGFAGGLIGYVYSPAAGAEEKYHSVMDSFSTCSVAGNEGGGGLVGSDMNKTTDYKRCYSAGPVVNVTPSGLYGGFAGRIDAMTLDNCSYNKNFYTSESGITAVGSGDTSNAIQGKTTKDMKVTGQCKTQVYDNTLTGTYPYRPVNTTGIVITNASGSPFEYTGMYYGDWEEPADVGIPIKPDDPETPVFDLIDEYLPVNGKITGYVYAYREKINGKWYWYILTADEYGEGSPLDYLSHANNVNVTDWEYGFIFRTDKANRYFTGPEKDDYDLGVPVKIKPSEDAEAERFYFLKFNNVSKYDAEGFAVSPPLKWNKKGYKIVFNNKFAAAMTLIRDNGMTDTQLIQTAKDTILGKGNKAYHVRCETQLNNIMTNGTYFPTKEFVQDCGFSVQKSSLTLPIATGTFSGKYDATYQDTELRYNIKYNGGNPDKLFVNATTGAMVKAQINNNEVNQP